MPLGTERLKQTPPDSELFKSREITRRLCSAPAEDWSGYRWQGQDWWDIGPSCGMVTVLTILSELLTAPGEGLDPLSSGHTDFYQACFLPSWRKWLHLRLSPHTFFQLLRRPYPRPRGSLYPEHDRTGQQVKWKLKGFSSLVSVFSNWLVEFTVILLLSWKE